MAREGRSLILAAATITPTSPICSPGASSEPGRDCWWEVVRSKRTTGARVVHSRAAIRRLRGYDLPAGAATVVAGDGASRRQRREPT